MVNSDTYALGLLGRLSEESPGETPRQRSFSRADTKPGNPEAASGSPILISLHSTTIATFPDPVAALHVRQCYCSAQRIVLAVESHQKAPLPQNAASFLVPRTPTGARCKF